MTASQRDEIISAWEEWRRALYEERAAIHEYLGGLSREEAEQMAFEKYKPEVRPIPEQRSFDL